ncbi:MAG: hypothetical protein QOJ16_561 [Acidobacteriota bacterium]|jgi:hypothetical protein|nr:hypothetical protein [Acidobacteriota bacterium]
MSSRKTADLLSLEKDLGLTEEDLRALRENRPQAWVNWWDQLTLVSEQFPNAAEALRRRPTFEGYEPFEL